MSAEQIAAVFAGRASVSLADITSEQAEFLDSQRCDFCAHWAHLHDEHGCLCDCWEFVALDPV